MVLVKIPENVQPGEEFIVVVGGRHARVQCPPAYRPGQFLDVQAGKSKKGKPFTFPHDSPNVSRIPGSDPPAYIVKLPEEITFSVTINGQIHKVKLPFDAFPDFSVNIVAPPCPSYVPSPPRPPMSPMSPRPRKEEEKTQLLEVRVPNGVQPGAPFACLAGSARVLVTCPRDATPGQCIQVPVPCSALTNEEGEKTHLFEVQVPKGAQPGAPFACLARTVRVLVTCPPKAGPGQRIRFKLPCSALTPKSTNEELAPIKVKAAWDYEDNGWTRTVRGTDLKFQWIRLDINGIVDLSKRFNFDKSAYVRKLEFREGDDDPRIRKGILSLVPAGEAVVDSRIKTTNEKDLLLTYSDLAQAQLKTFDEKTQWFQDTCAQLCVEWNDGHMRMNIRREFLLSDSVDAVMSLSRRDMRKLWRFEFVGEEGIDAGGLEREWFELVCKEIFDPNMGLWMSSTTNQRGMTINPASEFCCEDHLVYYRFLGRVIGKAMFDRQLVSGRMAKHIYKHMLGWPVQFKDLESVDEDYYRSLQQLRAMAETGEDVAMLCLDFTTVTEIMGTKTEVELVSGGNQIEVNNDNFPEYVEACLKYKLMDCVKPQLNELLLGFFDVIPEPLLTIFDFQELELLMCGLPEFDMEDWKEHTEYSGEYEDSGGDHPTCQWFWEVVSEFDHDMKARLLQFVTGTSGVPSSGFGALQGNDGNICKFTIQGLPVDMCLYPRAHTCFNRLDLPLFSSKEELREKLMLVVSMTTTGFNLE